MYIFLKASSAGGWICLLSRRWDMPPQQEANEADIHPVQEGHVTIVYIFLLYRRGLLVRRGRLAGGAGLAQPAQPINKKKNKII